MKTLNRNILFLAALLSPGLLSAQNEDDGDNNQSECSGDYPDEKLIDGQRLCCRPVGNDFTCKEPGAPDSSYNGGKCSQKGERKVVTTYNYGESTFSSSNCTGELMTCKELWLVQYQNELSCELDSKTGELKYKQLCFIREDFFSPCNTKNLLCGTCKRKWFKKIYEAGEWSNTGHQESPEGCAAKRPSGDNNAADAFLNSLNEAFYGGRKARELDQLQRSGAKDPSSTHEGNVQTGFGLPAFVDTCDM